MAVSAETFRRTLSCLAGGVTVVTARRPDGTPSGLTATSVCSVSLEPPLILVCLERDTRTHGVVGAAGSYAVNLLRAGQEGLARHFARDVDDKFDEVPHESGVVGAPILGDALGFLECVVVKTLPAGDHTIYVGEVRQAGAESREEAEPLLYFRSEYRALSTLAAGPRAGADREPR